jgi:hypothetical protein
MIGQELVIRIIVVTSQAPGVWPALFVARPRPILLPAPPPHRSSKLMNERRASLGNGSPLSPSADGRAIRRREAACDDEQPVTAGAELKARVVPGDENEEIVDKQY